MITFVPSPPLFWIVDGCVAGALYYFSFPFRMVRE
jgi:hypothetical protein